MPIPLKAPKGGHRRLPHFGKAFEEGKNRKGMNPRQETVPHLSSGVAECGKHNQRKAGGLEAPQSSLEAPKSRPGGSKIEPWGLQNRAWSPPRRHFEKRFNLRSLRGGVLTLIFAIFGQLGSILEAQEAPKSRPKP